MTNRGALPDPAAALPGEAAILAQVLTDLSDETAKLVYADWLEDHDDPRGPFLREFLAAARTGEPLPPSDGFPRPWRDLVGVTLTELARAHGFAERTAALLEVARPTIRITPTLEPDDGPLLARSRYGGPPDLPPDVEWPLWTNGKPLSFLGQIDLADLAESVVARDLPPAGLLSAFFYLSQNDHDVYNGPNYGEGNEGWRLFYFPPDVPLAQRPILGALARSRFPPHPLTLTETLELTDDRNEWYEQLRFGDGEDFERYGELLDELNDRDGYGDRLLGHIQNTHDTGGTSFERSWVALWNIGLTGKRSKLWWDHLSRLHISMDGDDLRAGRFERAGLESQWLCS